MENGPSNHNGEEKQIWERPWTLEEMRKNSASWSLAADSGLFLFLQDFSQRMLSKTHEIEKQLDGLIRDTKATDSCLHTVFNDFLMLSNTQFIENRVYDEEVEEPPAKLEPERQSELEKTREQKEAELIPKVQEAVNYGLQVLESAFEQLDIKAGNSDSEDEEATDRVEPILEPKDLYVDRPLPYLIGSQLFMETDDVGLGDLSSEELSIDSDRDSVAESEEDKDRDQSDEDFNPEEDGKGSFKKKSSLVSYEEDEDEEDDDSDIFGESDKEENGDAKTSAAPSSFADELAARIKGEPTSKPEPARAASSSISSVTKKRSKGGKAAQPPVEAAAQEEEDDDALFKPPKMEDDDDYSPFGGKGGLFSGGKGLFDDDDEADLFTEAPKRETQATTATAEPAKSKKIPTSGVSVFPENSLFGSPSDSDFAENKENGDPFKPTPPPMTSSSGGGLFDEDDDEDDFFSGKAIKKITSSQQKPQTKKSVDLFGGVGGEEEGDLFSEGSSAAPAHVSRGEPPEEVSRKTQAPEKKLPAGAISMFGPGTKNLLVEGLKKRQPSTSEESEKSESEPSAASKPPANKPPEKKAQSRGLFSDDEDSQIFPSITKSQSKPEPTTQAKVGKASLFDDEDDEDLFSSVSKPKTTQSQTKTTQASKPASSSLFSDDEDQWMGSSAAMGKDVKNGSMKASVSAPSSLPSGKAATKASLFDDDDKDDLFAVTKETSQKKQQRVSLLFQDDTEDDEKDSLFGFKSASSGSTGTSANVIAVAPAADPVAAPLHAGKSDEGTPSVLKERAMDDATDVEQLSQSTPSPSPEASEVKKKPAGAVSLFGGIDVLAEKLDVLPSRTTLVAAGGDEDDDDDFLGKEVPPPLAKSAKKTTLSLFEDDNDDENEDDFSGNVLVSESSKQATKNAVKEPKQSNKSTGVFQDEELLFSQTQQRDNDPDVDLFATSVKSTKPVAGHVKPVAPSLFGDEEEDDLFTTAKSKAPPRVAEKPPKPIHNDSSDKPSVSKSAENEASLAINPSSLLPGAAPPPHIPGAVSVLPGLPSPSSTSAAIPSSASPALGLPTPASMPVTQHQLSTEAAVSFDSPAQISTLQSANKGRTKGSIRRRPQTRAARQLAAQRSEDLSTEEGASAEAGPSLSTTATATASSSLFSATNASVSSSVLSATPTSSSLFASTTAASFPMPNSSPSSPSTLFPSTVPISSLPAAAAVKDQNTDSQAVRPKKAPVVSALVASDGDDLFGSDDLFAPVPPKLAPSPQPKMKTSNETSAAASKKDPALSIFDDHGEDLFQKVKQRPAKKAKASPFLEDEDDDDLFGISKSITKPSANKDTGVLTNAAKQDVFQDKTETTPKASKKQKEKPLDASLFDDGVDIFADLTPTTKLKEKKAKKKVETKSIFDDDTDDIFSSGTSKPVAKAPSKAKKAPPPMDPSFTEDTNASLFDDPLNVLGGN